jgi:TRAP-type C4-dicarboxylate transport system permease small subunit
MESALDRLIAVLSRISRATAWMAGLLLLLAALAIGFDIAIRYFLNRTIGGGNELAGYALALASAWGITATLLQRAHVRIDTIYVHLPARLRALLDVAALLSFVSFMTLVVWYGYFVLETSIQSNTHSVSSLEVPLAIPQFFWFAGLVFFLLVALALLTRASLAIARRDWRRVHALIGARSMGDEIEAERESLSGRQGPVDLMKGGGS